MGSSDLSESVQILAARPPDAPINLVTIDGVNTG